MLPRISSKQGCPDSCCNCCPRHFCRCPRSKTPRIARPESGIGTRPMTRSEFLLTPENQSRTPTCSPMLACHLPPVFIRSSYTGLVVYTLMLADMHGNDLSQLARACAVLINQNLLLKFLVGMSSRGTETCPDFSTQGTQYLHRLLLLKSLYILVSNISHVVN